MLHSLPRLIRRPLDSRRAFTLLEMIVTLMVIAAGTAVALPAYTRALDAYRVSQSTLRVLAELRLAKRYAQLQSASVYVDLDTSAHTLTVRGLNDFEKFGRSQVLSLNDETYRTRLTQLSPSDFNIIQFNGFGTAVNLGSFRLQSGQAQKTITIKAESIDAS